MATTTDNVSNPMHGLWGVVAPAWGEHAAFVDLRATPITSWLLTATAPGPGDRVLELACGAGGLGLAAAPRVVPGGEVVLSDVAPPMVEVASRRAVELGLPGVTTRVLDLEQIDEPDASFDVVLCRDGWQFATDPAQAVQQFLRVLVPGGRLGLAVWAARDRNPWLGLAFDAAAEQLGRPIPPPGVSGPFSLGDTALVTELLQTQAPTRSRSRSWPFPCTRRRSRRGGAGRGLWRGRSRPSSAPCRRPMRQGWKRWPERRRRPTSPTTAWSCPVSPSWPAPASPDRQPSGGGAGPWRS